MFPDAYNFPGSPYWDLLRTHHRVVPEVYILNNSGQLMGNASGHLVSGTIDMDAEADVTRSGKLSLLDPHNSLGLDFSGSAVGAAYYNRMVKVFYKIQSLDRTVTFRSPVFTGPITDANRNGVMVDLEVKGKEILAQDGMLNDYSWPAGWSRSAIIMNALNVRTGETQFSDQSNGAYALGAQWVVEQGENLWKRLKELADGMGAQLFYDGDGTARIRPKSVYPIFTIDTSWLTEEPDLVFDSDRIKNVVSVTGGSTPISPTENVKMKFEAWPSPQHPFSPQAIGRNGVPRVIPHFISDDSLMSFSDIINIAWVNLEADLLSCSGATAVSVIAPFLEENDVVTISHPKLYANVSMTKWTIPLVGDSEMSLNMFSSTSAGFVGRSNYVTNYGLTGQRLRNHGPSGAFNGIRNGGKGLSGLKGQDWYGGKDGGGAPGKSGGKKGGKKKNKNKGKKGKK